MGGGVCAPVHRGQKKILGAAGAKYDYSKLFTFGVGWVLVLVCWAPDLWPHLSVASEGRRYWALWGRYAHRASHRARSFHHSLEKFQ